MKETPPPPSGILLADHFIQPAGYASYRTSGTGDWLLFYTLSGEGRFRLGDLDLKTQSDEIILLAPRVHHDYSTASISEPWNFYWVHFLPRLHWSVWLQLPQLRPGFYQFSLSNATLETRNRLQQAFERMVRESSYPRPFYQDLALNALEEALILIAQQHSRATAPAIDRRVEVVLNHLAHNVSNPPSVADLANLVALSPSRLAHLFKEQMGTSIAATLLSLRLHHAARLLEFTSLPIYDIARQTGFQSPFHFSRQFKATYGQHPTAYRNSKHHQG